MSLDPSLMVPPEIGVHILNQLSPSESRSILSHLQGVTSSATDLQPLIIRLLYARLYGNSSVIYIAGEHKNDGDCESNKPTDCDFAATPLEMLHLCKDPMFLANRPKSLEFRITRNMREHTHFQNSLLVFTQMISTTWAAKYFGTIPQIHFSLNGESTMAGSPTSMSVAVLNVLAKMIQLGHCNISSFSISRTEIGRMFPERWEGVFRHLPSVEHLSLDNNEITSTSVNKLHEQSGVNMKWPAGLKTLSLAENRIPRVSCVYLQELPKSLQKLDLSNNPISSFCADADPSFTLASALPNLEMLDLSGNMYLSFIEPAIFGDRIGCEKLLTVNLRGCKIIPQYKVQLLEQASMSKIIFLM